MGIDWGVVGKWAFVVLLPIGGFIVGGGWPWKAYRHLSDLTLFARLRGEFVTVPQFDAHVREEELRHQRRDDIIDALTHTVRTVESFAGTLGQVMEATKHLAQRMNEADEAIDELQGRRPG